MKTGRPSLKKAQRKGSITAFRLRPDERKLLERAAAISREKLSEWGRNVLLREAANALHLPLKESVAT